METVRRLLFGLGMLPAFSLSCLAQTPAAPHAAVVIETEKTVEAQTRGAAWKAAAAGAKLNTNDRLRTRQFSRALVQVTDFGMVRLDELTTIEISPAYLNDPARDLEVKRGGIYFLNRDKPQEMRIRTAAANGALKGTEFAMRVVDGKTTVAMFEGELLLSNAQGRLLLKSNEAAVAEVGRAPRSVPMIEAVNIIQWCLYYPGVLDPVEIGIGKSAAFDAYRAGDLPRALASMKGGARSSGERLFRAALILSSGQVEQARAALAGVRADDPGRRAIERMIAAVQFKEWTGGEPRTAGEWVAESYYRQSRRDLDGALKAAREAMRLSPEFGFAWVRAAEMEFSFGRTLKAMQLLERALELAPRNAQAHALQGFLLAAENHTGAARRSFDEAIALDGALGNAWLGRGLTSIRQGREDDGRRDLQTAAALEPNRSLLRSYLGKAFSQVGRNDQANIEFARAKEIDGRDPTPWLYSAIQRKQENRYNEAVADLEKSIGLNKNRGVFRSKFLLDQDRSIRGTNLAAIYLNEGMTEQSVREAVRAVGADYSSAPAHLFLANSYDALRDPAGILTRYEAATFSELLVSNLLAPVGGGPLSQFVSQQEYSKLFEKDGVGFATDSTWFSTGEFRQTASQFGTVGNLGYALDAYYLHNRGQRGNNHFSTAGGFATFKLQLAPRDTVFFQASVSDTETGDVSQVFDPKALKRSQSALSLDFEEKQDPGLLLLGWHHEWNPQNHTLLLLGRLANRQVQTVEDIDVKTLKFNIRPVASPEFVSGLILRTALNDPDFYATREGLTRRGILYADTKGVFDSDYRASFAVWTAELQHIATIGPATLVLGGRWQGGTFDTRAALTDFDNGGNKPIERLFDIPPALQDESVDFERLNLYAYTRWQVTPWLSIDGGFAYDRLDYPENFRSPPINGRQASLEHVSPKAGLTIEPWRGATVRAAYTEAVSGTSFDESIRLEPAQVAGFVQTYRSLVSESLIGAVAGGKFRLSGLSLEQKLPTRTYLGVEFDALDQDIDRTIGVFEFFHATEGEDTGLLPLTFAPSSLAERDRYRERSLTATVNQLVGDRWSVGSRYRYTRSEFHQELDGFTEAIARGGSQENLGGLIREARAESQSELHQLSLFALYNHPCGFFARAEANWYRQENETLATVPTYSKIGSTGKFKAHLTTKTGELAGEDFWQFNVLAGWRFHRNQCEVSCGLLNITGEDYRLSPLNPYEELARDRTLVLRCRLTF